MKPMPLTPQAALSSLLTYLSPTRLTNLLDLYAALHHWLQRHRQTGIYEILEYDSTLELLDSRGHKAVFKKQQRVKFLQDYINTFQDYAWGDGEIFAEYKCSPGIVVDRYQEGDRWNILISLHETKNCGDIEDFYIERRAENGFLKTEETLQTEVRHHTKRLKMRIIFPKKRRCQRALLLQRSRHHAIVLGPEHFTDFPDGRQLLTWETKKIRRFEIYTLQWRW